MGVEMDEEEEARELLEEADLAETNRLFLCRTNSYFHQRMFGKPSRYGIHIQISKPDHDGAKHSYLISSLNKVIERIDPHGTCYNRSPKHGACY